jgi:hypothetical protein
VGRKGEATLQEGQSFGLLIKPSLSLLFSSSRGLARKLHPSSGRNFEINYEFPCYLYIYICLFVSVCLCIVYALRGRRVRNLFGGFAWTRGWGRVGGWGLKSW